MKDKYKIKIFNIKLISAGVSLVMLQSGCSIKLPAETESTNSVSTVIETTIDSYNTQGETISNSSSTQSETTETTVTETTLEPFECDIMILNDFGQYLFDNGYYTVNMPYALGYDNPYLNQLINDFMQSRGSEYTNLTAEDFNYFMSSNNQLTCFGNNGNPDCIYNSDIYPSEMLILVQSVLIENDLRMMIDEIPYTYFEERFPEFVSDQSAEYQNSLLDQYRQIISRIYDEQNNTVDMSSLDDYEYEIVLYSYLTTYNFIRYSYMYSAHVEQVRDEETGRNVLNPTTSQLENLNEGCGLDIGGDVTQVETREHFYETYGMYPEDALYRETRYEGNLTESNSMNSQGPIRQR